MGSKIITNMFPTWLSALAVYSAGKGQLMWLELTTFESK